jgi:2-hydroxy-3-keto-5-methylthiopentenyl-1-phosphate phosphatase
MVYIDDNTKETVQKIKSESIYFLVNFDNVITDNVSSSTWNTIINNMKLKKKYIKKVEELKFKSRSVELDSSLDFCDKCDSMRDIWKEHIDLLKELNVDDKKIKHFVSSKNCLRIRDGVKNFLKIAYEKNIPVIIISEGVANVIKCLLDYNNCNYSNISIVSNNLYTDNQNDIKKIIHPLNRNELSLPDDAKSKIKDRHVSILLASSINDINMLSKTKLKDSIKIAFLEKNINENFDIFLNYFNIICTHNTSFDLLTNRLKKI